MALYGYRFIVPSRRGRAWRFRTSPERTVHMKSLFAALVAAGIVVSACDSPSAGVESGPLGEVRLDSASAVIRLGDTLRVVARAYSHAGAEVPASIEWFSRDSLVASVSPAGTIRAHAVGATFVVARATHGLEHATDSLVAVVLPSHTREQAILVVLPSDATFSLSSTVTLTGYAAGAARGDYWWSISDSSVVRLHAVTVVSERLVTVAVEALRLGTTEVILRSTSGFAATATLRVQ
jgi:hypothetical protein